MMNLCIPTGNSKKGVVLYRNADVLLRSSQLEDCAYSFIIVCKVSVHVTTNAAIVTDILLLFLLNDNTFSRLHVRLSFPSRTVRVGSYRPDSRIPLTW